MRRTKSKQEFERNRQKRLRCNSPTEAVEQLPRMRHVEVNAVHAHPDQHRAQPVRDPQRRDIRWRQLHGQDRPPGRLQPVRQRATGSERTAARASTKPCRIKQPFADARTVTFANPCACVQQRRSRAFNPQRQKRTGNVCQKYDRTWPTSTCNPNGKPKADRTFTRRPTGYKKHSPSWSTDSVLANPAQNGRQRIVLRCS